MSSRILSVISEHHTTLVYGGGGRGASSLTNLLHFLFDRMRLAQLIHQFVFAPISTSHLQLHTVLSLFLWCNRREIKPWEKRGNQHCAQQSSQACEAAVSSHCRFVWTKPLLKIKLCQIYCDVSCCNRGYLSHLMTNNATSTWTLLHMYLPSYVRPNQVLCTHAVADSTV